MSDENPIEVIHNMLRTMVGRKASDLFIRVGFPPALKIDGKVRPISEHALAEVHTKHVCPGADERQAARVVRGDQGMQLRGRKPENRGDKTDTHVV